MSNNLTLTRASLPNRISSKNPLDLDFTELSELISQKPDVKDLRITGLYSEFTPLLNISGLFPRERPDALVTALDSRYRTALPSTEEYSLPLRLRTKLGLGVGGLYHRSSSSVYDSFIPVFYRANHAALQRNLTGWQTEIEARVIDIPERWSTLFFPRPTEVFGNKGLLLAKVRKLKKSSKFLLDLWRLDYFPFSNSEDQRVQPFQKIVTSRNWPKAAQTLASRLAFMSFEILAKRRVSAFGILPRVNFTNKLELRKARTNLRDYYRYAASQARSKGSVWTNLNMSTGSGENELTLTKRAKNVFQYDQVDPILSQEYKL